MIRWHYVISQLCRFISIWNDLWGSL